MAALQEPHDNLAKASESERISDSEYSGPRPPQDHEPTPAEYDLDEETVRQLSSTVAPYEILPGLLGWASLIVLLACCSGSMLGFLRKHELAWPVLFLGFVPGMLAGWAVNKFRKGYWDYSKTRHARYADWQRYLGAHSTWQSIRDKEQHEEGLRQGLLRKQSAQEIRKKLDWWKTLDGKRFEIELASLLRGLGYQASLTPYSGDGGVDIRIQDGAKRVIVQCKAHRNYTSPGVVRELYGTMIHEKADEGWVVTTSGFYSGARTFASGKPIRLLTIADLLRMAPNTGS
jgi:hypothetical protein